MIGVQIPRLCENTSNQGKRRLFSVAIKRNQRVVAYLISVEIVNFVRPKHVKSTISIERLQKKRYFERKVVISVGAIHSTKTSGNFGLKLNGSVRSNQKSFEKVGPPFEVDHSSRLERSDRFDHSDPFSIPVPRCSVLSMDGVTRTSMCSYNKSVAASQAKCMFWLLTALKDDLFPMRI